jgi:hypothetical protein
VTLVGTVALAALSIRQVATRAPARLDYPGMAAMSAPWEAPASDEGVWHVSTNVPPPPVSATRDQLVEWLHRHYPVLALEVEEPKRHEVERGWLHLGGGPPRGLYVIPGEGLVMTEP